MEKKVTEMPEFVKINLMRVVYQAFCVLTCLTFFVASAPTYAGNRPTPPTDALDGAVGGINDAVGGINDAVGEATGQINEITGQIEGAIEEGGAALEEVLEDIPIDGLTEALPALSQGDAAEVLRTLGENNVPALEQVLGEANTGFLNTVLAGDADLAVGIGALEENLGIEVPDGIETLIDGAYGDFLTAAGLDPTIGNALNNFLGGSSGLAGITSGLSIPSLGGAGGGIFGGGGPGGGGGGSTVAASGALPSPSPTSSTCDANIMRAIETRAWYEAQREVVQNQNLITKPDSVLAYSCFDQFLGILANAGTELFSENTSVWGGAVAHISPTSLDQALNVTAAIATNQYLNRQFNHSYLGGRGPSTNYGGPNVTPSATYNCAEMARVWQFAKCTNFAVRPEDGFMAMSYYRDNDPRSFPQPCTETDPRLATFFPEAFSVENATWRATHNPVVRTTFQTVYEHMQPGSCSNARRINTGISYSIAGVEIDDAVCINPGCVFDGTSCTSSY